MCGVATLAPFAAVGAIVLVTALVVDCFVVALEVAALGAVVLTAVFVVVCIVLALDVAGGVAIWACAAPAMSVMLASAVKTLCIVLSLSLYDLQTYADRLQDAGFHGNVE